MALRILFPRAAQPAVAGKQEPIEREWYKYLGELWSSLGHSPSLPMWSEVWADAHTMNRDSTVGLTLVAISAATVGIAFPNGADAAMAFSLRMPNNYVAGSGVVPFVEWMETTPSTNSVYWELTVAPASAGELFGTDTVIDLTSAGVGTFSTFIRKTGTEITGLDRNDVLSCMITRYGTADTYPDPAVLLGVGLKFKVASVGHERMV